MAAAIAVVITAFPFSKIAQLLSIQTSAINNTNIQSHMSLETNFCCVKHKSLSYSNSCFR